MINLIIEDINEKLNTSIKKENLVQLVNGASQSSVFNIDQYLIKTLDKYEYDSYMKFFNLYEDDHFQKIICHSKELSYICFKFIEGQTSSLPNIKITDVVEIIYHIVSNYKKYKFDGYGYLKNETYSWDDFLRQRAHYKSIIKINYQKVDESLKTIREYNIPKFLLHGDLGVHNSITNNNNLFIIDPRPLVGDAPYDFYNFIFSDPKIFTNLNTDYILSFFNRDYQYKKALMWICFYRQCYKALKYNKKDFPIYQKYLKLYDD